MTITDDFTGTNGDPPDPSLWLETDAYNKMDIQTNKLDFDSQDSSDRDAQIDSVFTIQGDFDVQIDIEEVDGTNPSSSVQYASLKVISDTEFVQISLARGTSGKIWVREGTSTAWSYISRSIDNSKLRLMRSGSVIKCYPGLFGKMSKKCLENSITI